MVQNFAELRDKKFTLYYEMLHAKYVKTLEDLEG